MRYRVHFRSPIGPVATAVLDRVRARLREISHTLGAVSSSDSFWTSIAENPLYVDVDGWRFKYSIDRTRKEFVVFEVVRVSSLPPVNNNVPLYKKPA